VIKRFVLGAAMAPLMFFGVASSSLAAPPEHAGEHHAFSAEDSAAFTDAHIAALKAGLKLTPAQEKNWPALESVLRDVAKARSGRRTEWHEKAREHSERPDPIEGLHGGAKALIARAGEMDKIADAAKPLYDSLDEAQKRRFGILLHALSRTHGHMGYIAPGGHEDAHGDE
jgi:hypothetical protein